MCVKSFKNIIALSIRLKKIKILLLLWTYFLRSLLVRFKLGTSLRKKNQHSYHHHMSAYFFILYYFRFLYYYSFLSCSLDEKTKRNPSLFFNKFLAESTTLISKYVSFDNLFYNLCNVNTSLSFCCWCSFSLTILIPVNVIQHWDNPYQVVLCPMSIFHYFHLKKGIRKTLSWKTIS